MKAILNIRQYTSAEVASVVGGELRSFGGGAASPVTSVIYDSRDSSEGSLFLAVKGERVDGFDYIESAVKGGASVVISDRLPESELSFDCVVVKDVISALGKLAADYRRSIKAKIVGVTGSVGKTTTKDFIASVAKARYITQKTEGNHNNEIGLPMTVLSLRADCQVAVLEMGMSALGEISYMTNIARPDISVITNIGTSHLENLGSRENICRAKLEITEGMSEGGLLIINGDEPLLFNSRDTIHCRVRSMGMNNRSADCKGMNVRVFEDKTVFDMVYDNKAFVNVEIPVMGRHNVYNAMAAYFTGLELGMTDSEIRRGLMSFEGTDMRQKIYPLGDLTVIEDCYNAAPESMRAALEVLAVKAKHSGGAATALLGTMLELGRDSRLMHDQLGQLAAQIKVSRLYCYGEMSETVAEAAIKKGVRADNVFVCRDISKPEFMARMIWDAHMPGDILLVKASRGVKAELVIEELKKLMKGKKTK